MWNTVLVAYTLSCTGYSIDYFLHTAAVSYCKIKQNKQKKNKLHVQDTDTLHLPKYMSALYSFNLSLRAWFDRQETVPSAFSWGPAQGVCVCVCVCVCARARVCMSGCGVPTHTRQ